MGANIDAISQQMAQQAANLDQQATQLRADAAQLLTDTQSAVNEYMANARKYADDMQAKAQQESDELISQAEEAKDNAKHWRHMSAEQRKKAKLPPLPDPPPAEQTRPDGEPRFWHGPLGRTWDLKIHYIDPSGALWHWAERYETVDGIDWPVMARDDFNVQMPLSKCPPLNAQPNGDGSDLRVAPGDPQTAVMPAITADQNGGHA